MREVLEREARVAFSKKSQPVWFRIVKWTVFLGVSFILWRIGGARFWYWLLAATLAGVTVHLIWRWKTQGWSRPWGGWHDLEADRG